MADQRLFGYRPNRLWYPTVEDIKQANKEVLKIYKVTKAERHEVLPGGSAKLRRAIELTKIYKGDVEDKAGVLLQQINLAHAFGSGNKRTAYFIANIFIGRNNNYMIAKQRDDQGGFALKVRSGEVDEKAITEWLRGTKEKKS